MGTIEAVAAPKLDGTFDDDKAVVFPSTYVHPNAGKYKDEPESFFLDKAVRVLVELGDGSKIPAWLDVAGFYDDTEFNIRLGRGTLRSTLRGYRSGAELAFHPSEVFDVIQRLVLPEGGVGGWMIDFTK